MNAKLIGVNEVCEQLNVSRVYAYKVIRKLNTEMQGNGCLVVPGEVSRSFFEERFFGAEGRDASGNAEPEVGKGDRNVG